MIMLDRWTNMRPTIVILMLVAVMGLPGQSFGSWEVAVTTHQGQRLNVRGAALGCGCESHAHRGQARSATIGGGHIFLETERFTAIIPLEILASVATQAESKARRDRAGWSVEIGLSDGTALSGHLFNSGPLTGEVNGRETMIPVIEIERLEILGKPAQSYRATNPEEGHAELVLRVLPKRTTLALSKAGFVERLPFPNKCEIPSELSDRLETTTGRVVQWDEIRSLYTFVSSSSRLHSSSTLKLELKGGEKTYIHPADMNGIMGVARIGTFDLLVMIPFTKLFRVDF